MRKLQKLKLFVLMSILMGVLIFEGISHNRGKGENKLKICEAVILDTKAGYGNIVGLEGSRNPDGEGWAYNDNEEDVIIYATIGKPYRMIFRFRVYYPLQIRFQGIQGNLYFDPDDPNYSKFPPNDIGLFGFLNGEHPYDEQYMRVDISFFGPFVDSKDDANCEKMDPGEERDMRAWISLDAHNLWGDCSECDIENYHSVVMNTYDASITRGIGVDVDSWIMSVDTYFLGDNNYMREKYCECVEVKPRKGKRPPIYKKENRYPAWGTGNLKFKIKFTRSCT